MIEDKETRDHLAGEARTLEERAQDMRSRFNAVNASARFMAGADYIRSRLRGDEPGPGPAPAIIEDGPNYFVLSDVAAHAGKLRIFARFARPDEPYPGTTPFAERVRALQRDFAEAESILTGAADAMVRNSNLPDEI